MSIATPRGEGVTVPVIQQNHSSVDDLAITGKGGASRMENYQYKYTDIAYPRAANGKGRIDMEERE